MVSQIGALCVYGERGASGGEVGERDVFCYDSLGAAGKGPRGAVGAATTGSNRWRDAGDATVDTSRSLVTPAGGKIYLYTVTTTLVCTK